MSHACVRRFDVMGTVEIILGTKHPLSLSTGRLVFCQLVYLHTGSHCKK